MRYKYVIQGTSQGFYAHATADGDSLVFGCTIADAGSNAKKIKKYVKAAQGIGSRAAAADVTVSTGKIDGHFITEEQGLTASYDTVAKL